MQKPYRFRLMNKEMVGGAFSKSPTTIPMGKITRRCIHCHCVYALGHVINNSEMRIRNISTESSHLHSC